MIKNNTLTTLLSQIHMKFLTIKKIFFVITILPLILSHYVLPRSIFRPVEPSIATIHIKYPQDLHYATLHESHLTCGLFFLYDEKFFMNHLFPKNTPISYRYEPQKTVSSAVLSELIEEFVREIQAGRRFFTHFITLKQDDFARKYRTGLIIARFRNYPFIVKLSIETPESFIDYRAKGGNSIFLFNLGGGVNRHLSGLTRIKNLKYSQKIIAQNQFWKDKVGFPKKWHWLPKQPTWLEIKSENIGTKDYCVKIPAIYAIIAEEIEADRTFSLLDAEDRHFALEFSCYLNGALDSHFRNYFIEKNTRKVIIIDTEHFPTIVGLREPPPTRGYFSWYSHLANKMLADTFSRNKQKRREMQSYGQSPLSLPEKI